MCGIAGIWNYDGSLPASERIVRMMDAMNHRGPDSRGAMEYSGGAAGMVRLALVDLSPRGVQPMWSPCGKVAILFNGEIYNFREERKRLEQRGHSFHSNTDTEVVLHAYLENGEEFVHHLRGMFAIALFDWRKVPPDGPPTVTLVRGPLGIKPLYVAEVGGDRKTLVFSSELRSLLASGLVERRVNGEAFRDFLEFGFVVQPRSIIRGVRMLMPGTIERFEAGRPHSVRRYWKFPPYEPRNESFEVAAERLRHELEDSVRLHSLADAPVGAFLSGGIDSTCITALMRKHVADLHTYTFRFPEFPDFDESKQAQRTAQIFECKNTTVDVTGADVRRLLPAFAAAIDQPSFDGLNSWLVSRRAAEDVKGVVSGLGGDEWFAGYPVILRMLRRSSGMLGRAGAVTGWAAQHLRRFVAGGALARRLEGIASRRSLLSLWMQPHTVYQFSEVSELTGASIENETERWLRDIHRLLEADYDSETPVGMGCLLDVFVFEMCQLLRDADATSMSCSLELRVPFVDLRLAEFSRTCRDEYKLSLGKGRRSLPNHGSKMVLIKAVEDLLPEHVKNSPKRGFVMPLQHWMKTDLRDLVAETCSPQTIKSRGLLDPAIVARFFGERDAAPPGLLYPRLWSLMIFELWARSVLDAPSPVTSHCLTV